MIQKITQNNWNLWTVNLIMRAKNVIQSSDFPVRRTGSYRHKKALGLASPRAAWQDEWPHMASRHDSGCQYWWSTREVRGSIFCDLIRPDPIDPRSDPIRPADHNQNTDSLRPTHDDDKGLVFITSLNVIHVVKFILKNVHSCEHDTHEIKCTQ